MIICKTYECGQCDMCKKTNQVILSYSIYLKDGEHVGFHMCEDCSTGLSNAHYKVIDGDNSYIYTGGRAFN